MDYPILRSLPGEPDAAGTSLGLAHLFVSEFQVEDCRVDVEPLAAHNICVQLGRVADADRVIGERIDTGPIEPGEISITAAGQHVQWRARGPVDFLMIRIDASFVCRVADELGMAPESGLEVFNAFRACDAFLRGICCSLHREARAGGVHGRLYAESTAQILAVHLLRNYSNARPEPTPTTDRSRFEDRLFEVLDYVNGNLAEEISLDDMAERSGMSAYHFARRFKAAMGRSPYRYVLERRIDLARSLLLESDHPLGEIALATGFSSQSHFTTTFRRMTGRTPGQFRISGVHKRAE